MATWTKQSKNSATYTKQSKSAAGFNTSSKNYIKGGNTWLYGQTLINYGSDTGGVSGLVVRYGQMGSGQTWTKQSKS